MTFPSFRVIVALTMLVASALYGIDYWKNPQRAIFGSKRVPRSVAADRPSIRLGLNHLCCDGCLSGLEKALSKLPWLDGPELLERLPARAQADQTPLAQMLPDFRRFDPTVHILQFRNMPWSELGVDALWMVIFALPIIAVGYLMIRKQELA